MGRLVSCAIVNETKERIPRSVLCACVEETVKQHGAKADYALSIVFVSEKKIQRLNKIYRNLDTATDVLSFASQSFDGGDNKEKYLGEIMVCPAFIRSQDTGKMRWELCHVVVHGTFHLLGKHHEHSEKAREKVHEFEEKIIQKILN